MTAASGWTWEGVKSALPVGSTVTGTVTQVQPYGVWVDLGLGFAGLMLVPDSGLGKGQQTTDFFEAGQTVTATVLWHNDQRQQVQLTRRV